MEREPERERLAQAIRAVIDHVVDTKAPPEVLAEAAREVERLAELLGPHPRRGPKSPHLPDLGELQRTFWRDPVVGKSNPVAPPVEIEIADQVVTGRANLASGNVGMTGTLTIKYRRPTPLHTELVFRGGTERVSGRKIFVAGTLHVEDTLTAEAEGLFVNLLRPRAAEYFENGRAVP